MKNKIVSVILSLLMCVTYTGIPAGALDESAQGAEPEVIVLEGDSSAEPSKYGLTTSVIRDRNGKIVVPDLIPQMERYAEFERRYNSYEKGYVTSVKNQGLYGVCWSFAGLSCAETSLIMQGLANRSIDFSERHLNWFAKGADCEDTSDPLYGGCKNLGTGAYNYLSLYEGGNYNDVTFTLARGCGPVNESLFPYSYTQPIDESYRYSSLARLSDTALFDPSDTDGIKGAIMNYGSLYCSMNYFTDLKDDGADYLNDDTAGYYCPVVATKDTKCGHAVTIVGWDDDYSKDNFLITPPDDGAWIIKNSHGTSSGDNGFFYLSYYDKTYSAPDINCIAAFVMAPADDYSNVYQYDAYVEGARIGYSGVNVAGANIFTAERNENIEAVSFHTTAADTDYIIQVYRGLSGSSPTSGTLVCSQEGRSPYAGYHTVELDEPAYVGEGEGFSVVVILSPDSEKKAYISIDNYAPKTGQSFFTFYKDGSFGSWIDVKTKYGSNVCIKAFTNAADVTESDIVSIDSSNFPDSTFRELVKTFDTNNSGGLSQFEADAVKTINIAGTSSQKGVYTDLTGIEYFKNLTELNCSYNSITFLDVSENTALTSLKCDYNELTYLITGNNSKLSTLWCDNNRLTSLDLSGNTGITSFYGSSNSYSVGALSDTFSLSSLPGNFDVSKASDWSGAVCDMTSKTLGSFTSETVTYTYDCGSGKTVTFKLVADSIPQPDVVTIDSEHFPDAVFMQYVKNNFDSDGSGGLSESEAAAVTLINVNDMNIGSIKGIEYFPNLDCLCCTDNSITSIDMSDNTKLKYIFCERNKISNINVTGCTGLITLSCFNNELSSLNVSYNTKLQYLWCHVNSISELSLSNNTQLLELDCTSNKLTALDVSNNPKLIKLFTGTNMLTALDISNLSSLEEFYGSDNTYYIGEVSDSFGLSALKGFDAAKASGWKGAVYDSSSNSLIRFTSGTITYNYDCGNGKSVTFTLAADGVASLIITAQPADTAVIEGLDASLSVTAEGEGLTYKWQKLTGDSWVNISGAASSVLELNNVTYDMDGTKFRCIIGNGSAEVTSDEAVLKVKAAEQVSVSEVTAMSIDEAIKFVNAYDARYDKSGQDTYVLTAAQMKAVEMVLEHDFKA